MPDPNLDPAAIIAAISDEGANPSPLVSGLREPSRDLINTNGFVLRIERILDVRLTQDEDAGILAILVFDFALFGARTGFPGQAEIVRQPCLGAKVQKRAVLVLGGGGL